MIPHFLFVYSSFFFFPPIGWLVGLEGLHRKIWRYPPFRYLFSVFFSFVDFTSLVVMLGLGLSA